MFMESPVTVGPPVEAAPEFGTVAHEALRLDRLFPGWYENIDTDELDMLDGDMCILGQGVADHYFLAMKQVRDDAAALGQIREVGDLFFENESKLVENYVYDELVPQWTAEIERRRSGHGG